MSERDANKPAAGIDVTALSVLDVLELCERDLVFFAGCTMTDSPDLPLSPETSWKMDVSVLLAAIACAKEKLCGPEVAHIASEDAGCRTSEAWSLDDREFSPELETAADEISRRLGFLFLPASTSAGTSPGLLLETVDSPSKPARVGNIDRETDASPSDPGGTE